MCQTVTPQKHEDKTVLRRDLQHPSRPDKLMLFKFPKHRKRKRPDSLCEVRII